MHLRHLRYQPSKTLLPGGRKFCKITKGAVKNILWPTNFGGCTAPILVKRGGKRAGTYFLIVFSFLQGQFRQKVNFWCCEFGLIMKYFLPKRLKNATMTMQNFLILMNFFSQIGQETEVRPGNSAARPWTCTLLCCTVCTSNQARQVEE